MNSVKKLAVFFIFLCNVQYSNIGASIFSIGVDTTQAKVDGKEMFASGRQEAETFTKNVPSMLLDALNKPENREKFVKFLEKICPSDALIYLNGSKEEQEDVAKRIVGKLNGFVNTVGQEAEKQKVYENIRNLVSPLAPSPWYLARYGFIFGAAVFAGFNGLYYVQQAVKDYLAIRKPKYISPLSSIGVFDQYKQRIKTFVYGLKKRKNDDEAQVIAKQLQNSYLQEHTSTKKQYHNFFIQYDNALHNHDTTRLFGAVAQKLGMDFIAISSINLLQKNTIVELCNELVQIIYKNNRPVLLYIDQAELLSMDGTEYSEREDCIKILASCLQSSMAILRSKCMIIGLSHDKEAHLSGPFTKIFTKRFVL